MPRREAVPIEPEPSLAITYIPLGVLARWAGNPKDHDVGAICASIERFGFRDPLGVNRRTHEIEEGHGRVEALIAMAEQGCAPPEFILTTDDGDTDWYVPVVYFDDDDRQAHAYALAHNKTQELGGYHEDNLLAALREQAAADNLLGTGFDGDDVDDLQRRLEVADPRPEEHTSELQS